MIDVRQLRYFIAVAEELHFTRAAERLHIAQPPLSTQIKALEADLGCRLFDRNKRRVSLTQAGRHFLIRARQILASLELSKQEVQRASQGEIGYLQLGYTATAIFSKPLTHAIKHYQKSFPQVVMALSEMTSVAQLNALHYATLDVGVLRRPDIRIPEGILIEEWYRSPLVLAVRDDHPLARRRAVSIKDIKDYPLITYPKEAGIGLYWQLMSLCAKAGFRPQIAHEVLALTTIVGLVNAGAGIAVVPADTRALAMEGVRYLPLRDKEANSSLYLAYRQADTSKQVAALLRQLREAVRGLRAD